LEPRTNSKRDRQKELETLEDELKMVTQTIDKLNNKRVVLLTKIYQLKNGSN
jgi:hypothetical protein